jgi:hypothetical protein
MHHTILSGLPNFNQLVPACIRARSNSPSALLSKGLSEGTSPVAAASKYRPAAAERARVLAGVMTAKHKHKPSRRGRSSKKRGTEVKKMDFRAT